MDRKLFWWGISLSVAFIFIIVFLKADELVKIGELSLNEFGDFLAGVAGPIAILWLVLSFKQQSIDLVINQQALLAQTKEIRNSVDQHRQLVHTEKQILELSRARSTRKNQPRFGILSFKLVKNVEDGPICCGVFEIINQHGEAYNARIIGYPEMVLENIDCLQAELAKANGEDDLWPAGVRRKYRWNNTPEVLPSSVTIVIKCIDDSRATNVQLFSLDHVGRTYNISFEEIATYGEFPTGLEPHVSYANL